MDLCRDPVDARAGDDLVREGDRPTVVHVLLQGWAFRYKLLPDGGRQILAYLIPGDLCDDHSLLLQQMDHNIGVLSDAVVARVPGDMLRALLDRHRGLATAMSWSTLVEVATLREWLTNTARREPFKRIAHLFCELWSRMRAVGLVCDGQFDLPLTQAELGDTVGLNAVTVNRMLQRLRGEGLIALKGRRLTILAPERLLAICAFDANYLHLPETPQPKRN